MPPPSILVVEDEPTLRRLLEYRLSRSYRVRVATNGVEALALIDAELPHLIVSDIMMPQMDGFALHAALQERPNTRVLPFIFLTAKADEQSRMRGLRTGVDDYITKPFDIEQLLERISRLLERTRVYQTQLSGEIGQDFSQRLMPRSLPEIPGYRFAFHNSPRDQGGGDFFDWAETHPGVFFFTVGDVMGKGLKAKFYAFSFLSYVRGTLYSMVEQTSSPAALMQQLNRRLMQDAVMEDTFASLLLVRFDAAAHRVTLCNAGHCRPVRLRGAASDGDAGVVSDSDLVLGLTPDAEFADTTIEVAPGDALFAYTDGLLEQRLTSGEMVGEAGLINAAARVHQSRRPLDALTLDLLDRSADPEFADDVLAYWLQRDA